MGWVGITVIIKNKYTGGEGFFSGIGSVPIVVGRGAGPQTHML